MTQHLSRSQETFLAVIAGHPNGTIKKHMKGSGTVVWRLFDDKMNAVSNIPSATMNALLDKGFLKKDGDKITIVK